MLIWTTVVKYRLHNSKGYKDGIAIEQKADEWVEGLPPIGEVCQYSYCRGREYSGVCLIRGYDDHEVWCKTVRGTNHFDTKNFVVTNDCEFRPIKSLHNLVVDSIIGITFSHYGQDDAIDEELINKIATELQLKKLLSMPEGDK